MNFCMLSACPSLVRYLLHSLAFMHLLVMSKMEKMRCRQLSLPTNLTPWFHSDHLSRLHYAPTRRGNDDFPVGAFAICCMCQGGFAFGSNKQSAVRSPRFILTRIGTSLKKNGAGRQSASPLFNGIITL